jgi:hypothetical protein
MHTSATSGDSLVEARLDSLCADATRFAYGPERVPAPLSKQLEDSYVG